MTDEEIKKFLEDQNADYSGAESPSPVVSLGEQMKSRVAGPKGSANRAPSLTNPPPAIAAVMNNFIPIATTGGIGVAGLGLELGMNELFPPEPSEVRAEMAGSVGEQALNFFSGGRAKPIIEGGSALRRMLTRGAAGVGAVGLEQGAEVAAGTVSPLEAVVNTVAIGASPAAFEGLFTGARKVGGRTLLGKGPDELTQKFSELTELNINDLGYAAGAGKGGLQQLLLLTENLPFVEKIRLARDQRLTEGFFTALRKLDLSPDVAINPASPGVSGRTLQEITEDTKKAFFVEKFFQDDMPDGSLKRVKRLPQAGDDFELIVDTKKGTFSVKTNAQFGSDPGPLGPNSKAVKLTKETLEGLQLISKDGGLIAENIGKGGANIEQVLALRAVLPLEDADRVKNAFINNFLLGGATIVDSAKGIPVDQARGTLSRTLAVDPIMFRKNIENFSKEEKLLNVMKMGIPGTNEQANQIAERQLKDLSDLAEFMVKNSVDVRDITKPARFAQYAGNKMLFQIINPGTVGTGAAAGTGALLALNGLVMGGIQVGVGVGVAATAGTLISMVLTEPGAMRFMREMASGKPSPGAVSFMRGLKARGWDFMKNPEDESEVMLLPPPGKNEEVLRQPPRPPSLQDFIRQRFPRSN